jgi:hypothetical protein
MTDRVFGAPVPQVWQSAKNAGVGNFPAYFDWYRKREGIFAKTCGEDADEPWK